MPPKKVTKPDTAPSRPKLARGAKTTASPSNKGPLPPAKKAPTSKKVAFNRDLKLAPLKKTTKNTAKIIEKRPPTPGLKPDTTASSTSSTKKPRGRPAKAPAPASSKVPAPTKAPKKAKAAPPKKGKERAQTSSSESESAPDPSRPSRSNAGKTVADYAEEVIQQMNEYQQKLVDGHAKMHKDGKAVCVEGKCPGFEPFPKLEMGKIFGKGDKKWMKSPYPEGLDELIRDGNRIVVPENLRGVLEEGEDPFKVLRGLGSGRGGESESDGEQQAEGSRSRGKVKTPAKASGSGSRSKGKNPAKASGSGSGSGVKKSPGSPKSPKKTPGKRKGPER